MEGEEMSAQAMLRRRFSPPDSPRTRMPPGSAPPTCSNDRQELLRTALECARTATTCTDLIPCTCSVPGRNLMQGCAAACRRAAPSWMHMLCSWQKPHVRLRSCVQESSTQLDPALAQS